MKPGGRGSLPAGNSGGTSGRELMRDRDAEGFRRARSVPFRFGRLSLDVGRILLGYFYAKNNA